MLPIVIAGSSPCAISRYAVARLMPPHVLREAVDADHVARAIFWAATASSARNETFNITNGDAFIWNQIWPAIADTFGMPIGREKHFAFARSLPALADQWAQLVERHRLNARPAIEAFVGANSLVYTDMNFFTPPEPRVAALNSTIKLRQAAFHECLDTEDMFRSQVTKLQASSVLPRRPTSA